MELELVFIKNFDIDDIDPVPGSGFNQKAMDQDQDSMALSYILL